MILFLKGNRREAEPGTAVTAVRGYSNSCGGVTGRSRAALSSKVTKCDRGKEKRAQVCKRQQGAAAPRWFRARDPAYCRCTITVLVLVQYLVALLVVSSIGTCRLYHYYYQQ
jgi:hypothetical protein